MSEKKERNIESFLKRIEEEEKNFRNEQVMLLEKLNFSKGIEYIIKNFPDSYLEEIPSLRTSVSFTKEGEKQKYKLVETKGYSKLRVVSPSVIPEYLLFEVRIFEVESLSPYETEIFCYPYGIVEGVPVFTGHEFKASEKRHYCYEDQYCFSAFGPSFEIVYYYHPVWYDDFRKFCAYRAKFPEDVTANLIKLYSEFSSAAMEVKIRRERYH